MKNALKEEFERASSTRDDRQFCRNLSEIITRTLGATVAADRLLVVANRINPITLGDNGEA